MSSRSRPIDLAYDSDDNNVDTAVLEFERFLQTSFKNDTTDMNKPSFPLMLTPIMASSSSEEEGKMACPICFETRPKNHFYLFECGHGVCKIEDICKKYDLETCAICKRPRNIEDEVAKFSVFEEEEKRKARERVFEDEVQRVLELSVASECFDEKKYEEEIRTSILFSMKCEQKAAADEIDEGYVSSDSTITGGYDSDGSTITLDDKASIATMTEWNILVPRKKQRRL